MLVYMWNTLQGAQFDYQLGVNNDQLTAYQKFMFYIELYLYIGMAIMNDIPVNLTTQY